MVLRCSICRDKSLIYDAKLFYVYVYMFILYSTVHPVLCYSMEIARLGDCIILATTLVGGGGRLGCEGGEGVEGVGEENK
jgi:hypothetical protein